MRSQVLIIEAMVVFLLVSVALLLVIPIHQDIHPLTEFIRRADSQQVRRLLNG